MPRVPYLRPEDVGPEESDLVVSSLQDGKPINIYGALGNNPAVLRGLRSHLGTVWSETGLSDRERELVILSVGHELESPYEWHQHVNIATDVGLTPAEIAAVAADDPDPFSAEELAMMEYARAVARGEVPDDVHAAVADRFDDATVVGLTVLAATYLLVERVIDALEVDIEAGEAFVGWDLE
jgi:alkylhydroperoxidase family enzyme